MNSIKTAISIDRKTFASVNKMSRKLRISRSQFFSQAARYMVEKDENLDLIRRINAAFEHDPEDDTRLKSEKTYARKQAHGQW
jgi:metal-responsive CopG/Arc/MetJ family transcriptional regulator